MAICEDRLHPPNPCFWDRSKWVGLEPRGWGVVAGSWELGEQLPWEGFCSTVAAAIAVARKTMEQHKALPRPL